MLLEKTVIEVINPVFPTDLYSNSYYSNQGCPPPPPPYQKPMIVQSVPLRGKPKVILYWYRVTAEGHRARLPHSPLWHSNDMKL
jgi:hypothetical protein